MSALSISKFEEDTINEDAAKATREWIAVSDGAGGGGVFADLWSDYLVAHLPDMAINNFHTFDEWIDKIWEPFYNDCEEKAKAEGGMLLNKFFDEGSFATLVAVWKDGCWMSYGDSVAFCYDYRTKTLKHSFERLVSFNKPPYLISCKDPSNEDGFKCGKFDIHSDSLVFAASDTLAHYILMMYEVSHYNLFVDELSEAIDAKTKNSNLIKTAIGIRKIDFEKDVITKLLNCKNAKNFERHLQKLKRNGLIGHDDYSLVILDS